MISAKEARKLVDEQAAKSNQSALDACESAIMQAVSEGKHTCKVNNIKNAETRMWLLTRLASLKYTARCVYPTDQRDSTYIEISW